MPILPILISFLEKASYLSFLFPQKIKNEWLKR